MVVVATWLGVCVSRNGGNEQQDVASAISDLAISPPRGEAAAALRISRDARLNRFQHLLLPLSFFVLHPQVFL